MSHAIKRPKSKLTCPLNSCRGKVIPGDKMTHPFIDLMDFRCAKCGFMFSISGLSALQENISTSPLSKEKS